jgi:hypothetical protein
VASIDTQVAIPRARCTPEMSSRVRSCAAISSRLSPLSVVRAGGGPSAGAVVGVASPSAASSGSAVASASSPPPTCASTGTRRRLPDGAEGLGEAGAAAPRKGVSRTGRSVASVSADMGPRRERLQ